MVGIIRLYMNNNLITENDLYMFLSHFSHTRTKLIDQNLTAIVTG